MSLVADLKLRFGPVRLPARVYLSAPRALAAGRPTLVVWLAGRKGGDVLCRDLSAAAAAVVLELPSSGFPIGGGHELAALAWAAEHASEFGVGGGSLVVGGQLAGAARAARLALDARDSGWPALRRQVLVRPTFAGPGLVPTGVAGIAPATIVTNGLRGDDGSRFAATLRGAGVAVQELVSDARRALPVHELAAALR
ncbi:MAG: alpha/beta hydrolase fold domain-containing protein [Solirubrobacterales bacterium]|nr:alpha/beta hydrolase fold domain-containing protein [Solirubrobacterales bacterium]